MEPKPLLNPTAKVKHYLEEEGIFNHDIEHRLGREHIVDVNKLVNQLKHPKYENQPLSTPPKKWNSKQPLAGTKWLEPKTALWLVVVLGLLGYVCRVCKKRIISVRAYWNPFPATIPAKEAIKASS
ncbi:MAG: hypothetical protein ACPGC9_01995 [Cytophagales bacterium]